MRASLLSFSIVVVVASLAGCPQEGFWPDDIPRTEGEGEGEGEELCDPACEDGSSCRDGTCLADDLFCSVANPTGVCATASDVCVDGTCVAGGDACSEDNLDGQCGGDLECRDGVCASDAPCALGEPNGFCTADAACVDGRCQDRDLLCSTSTPTGLCRAGFACDAGTCSPVEAQCGCVGTETCVDGVCRAPEALCSAANPAGLCDDGGVCVAGDCVDVGAGCSVDNPTGVCPPGSLCDDGTCTGIDGATLCDDDNDCTVDAFDAVRNRCSHDARTGSCDDGNACTTDTCSDGQCNGALIGGCVEPPVLDAVVSPTNVGALTIAGTKPAGSSVVINELTAVSESPDERWQVTVNLVPGDNIYVVKSVDQGTSSATRELNVVYDITAPRTRVTPDGGRFLVGVTATIASDEPARVYFTTDGREPDETSAVFTSLRQLRIFTSSTLRFRAQDIAGNWEAEIVDVAFEVSGRGTSWREAPALGEGLINAAAAVVDGNRLIVVGGSDGAAPQAGVTAIDVDTNAQTTLASLSAARSGLTALVHEGKLYAIGGENAGVPKNTVEVLEGAAWVVKAPMPSTRHALSGVSVNGKVYVFGGKTNGGVVLTNLEVYDASANSWSNAVAQLPRARAGGRAVVVGARVFLVGGEGTGGAPLAEVDVYTPSTDTWTTAAALPTPRNFAGIGVVQNRGRLSSGQPGIVVAGGLAIGGAPVATVEEYLVNEDRWVERAPLDRARHAAASVDVDVEGSAARSLDDVESEVWLLGGQVGADVVSSGRAFRSPRDWARRLADLPASRFLHGAAVVDEIVYVIGGRSFREESIGWAFDPETGAARELPAMQSIQSGLAVVAAGGRVYAIGGADAFGNAVPTNRAFDPAERRFVELLPMTSARSEPAAAVVGDKIVVIGGDNGGALQTVEIYDTVANSWLSGPLLPGPRAGAMAVERDGDVIVTGGVDGSGAVVSSILRSTRNVDGVITGWEVLSGSIPVERGTAVIERDELIVFPGRTSGELDGTPFVFNLVEERVRLRTRPDHQLLPALDKRAGVKVLGKLLLIGGNDDAATPAGSSTVVEARLTCLNGARDAGEEVGADSAGDSSDGCGDGGFVHNTGLGGTFVDGFPNSTNSVAAAIRACNAHFGITTCAEACSTSTSCNAVSRTGACSCDEAPAWHFTNGSCTGSYSIGSVNDNLCGTVIGNWN
ncbi:MAG: kelch repeat-containing protein [Deltaproteobacteria bacterium]|nr:kelch repeat-containing protein [Deltaproteobacteria bacterium]